MKPGKFRLTTYQMGRAVTTQTIAASDEATLRAAAERMSAHGLPGQHPKAAARSRVVGVSRL